MNQAEKVAEVKRLLQEIYLDEEVELHVIRYNMQKLRDETDRLFRRM